MANNKNNNKLQNVSFFILILVIITIAVTVVRFIKINNEKQEKEIEHSVLSSIYESESVENSNRRETIENGIDETDAEQYAEDEGYIKPNQHIYMDITPGSKK